MTLIRKKWPLSHPTANRRCAGIPLWLLTNRPLSTTTTYLVAITNYLHFLDSIDKCPGSVQLDKLAQQCECQRIERNRAATVVDKDEAWMCILALFTY